MRALKKDTLACPECGSRFTDGRAHCSFDGLKLVAGGPDPLVGKKLDQYEVLERIGSGGMAAVYRVRHVRLQQEYALKMLAGELASNQLVVQRFLREAQAAAKIDHPNVVKVVYSGTTELGLAFLVMELIHGVPLDTVIQEHAIKKEAVPPQRAALIARQVALGLAEIHRAGFVHRDVKPSNIMLVEHAGTELVKILDLGVVGVIDPTENNPRVTKADHIVGTPQYMAPEALSGDPYHASADLYALGVVLYEMLTGRAIFDGTIAEIFWSQLNAQPEPLPRLGGIEELTHQLLAKSPEARPQSAEAVARAIDHLLTRGKLLGVVEDAPSRARRALSRAFAMPAKPRRLKWWLVAVASLAVVLGLDIARFRSNQTTVAPLLVAETPAVAVDDQARREQIPARVADTVAPAPELEPVESVAAKRPVVAQKKIARAAAKTKIPPPKSGTPGEAIEVKMDSDPPGAAVLMSGGQLGLTPLTVAFEKDRPVALIFRLDGFPEKKVLLRPTDQNPTLFVRMARGSEQ